MPEKGDLYGRIYEIVRQIPVGRVTSYGAIASCVGGGARLVGWAMNASHHNSFHVPAHRVVNRNGMLTGKHHFDTPDAMQQLLENEGVTVIDDKIVGFSEIFWDPVRELESPFSDDISDISENKFNKK